jgi:transposase
MHDGSKAHRNKKIDQYLEDCEVEFLDWPPYSPDLNPIENIWAWIKYKLYSEYWLLNSKDEIIEAVQAIWDQIEMT